MSDGSALALRRLRIRLRPPGWWWLALILVVYNAVMAILQFAQGHILQSALSLVLVAFGWLVFHAWRQGDLLQARTLLFLMIAVNMTSDLFNL